MFEQIESIIADSFGISRERLIGKELLREVTDAKHFLYYILYFIYGYKAISIAERYGVTKVNVYSSIRQIHNGIRTQKYYANIHARILKDILEKGGDLS